MFSAIQIFCDDSRTDGACTTVPGQDIVTCTMSYDFECEAPGTYDRSGALDLLNRYDLSPHPENSVSDYTHPSAKSAVYSEQTGYLSSYEVLTGCALLGAAIVAFVSQRSSACQVDPKLSSIPATTTRQPFKNR